MLNTIKSFFEQNIASDEADDIEHQLKLATAALLIEMMQQDHEVHEEERQAVKASLKEIFTLSEDETEEIFNLAQKEANEATDYHQFTRLIAKEYTQDQKIKVIELLWTIAYADNHLDSHEEHMVRRIADLIYVPHKDLIKTKHKVQNGHSSGSNGVVD
jgi:uncharacterized tellurite resistance protein B-like protein